MPCSAGAVKPWAPGFSRTLKNPQAGKHLPESYSAASLITIVAVRLETPVNRPINPLYWDKLFLRNAGFFQDNRFKGTYCLPLHYCLILGLFAPFCSSLPPLPPHTFSPPSIYVLYEGNLEMQARVQLWLCFRETCRTCRTVASKIDQDFTVNSTEGSGIPAF